MNNKFLTLFIFLVVLTVLLFPNTSFGQNPAGAAPIAANVNNTAGNSLGSGLFQIAADAFLKPLFLPIGQFLLTISSLFLIITGWIFDGIVDITIVNVADYLGSGTEMGKAILQAWSTLRDIANIFFIFVLIYAALKAMFDLNFGSSGALIKNIILVALLINFSLFFTKVVIDASNVVSMGFYQSIIDSNTASFQNANFTGISAGYMRMLGLQSMFDPEILIGQPIQNMFILSIMGSMFLLIASIIFIISGIMFISRFVILIFLMILSPLALIAIIIPGGMATFNKWKDALISQSFFAPLFFALTWVSFKLGSALLTKLPVQGVTWINLITSTAANRQGVIALLLSYTLIIGFSIAALVFAKSMATKTAGFTQISGFIGTGAVGATAWAGRQTIGRGGQWLTNRAGLQEAANKERKTFGGKLVGGLARATVYAGEKARSGTFDARNASIPTSVIGDAVQGTIGRTKLGKSMGLNDVNIPNVKMDAIVKDMDLLGKGGTKGFKETREESQKRVQEREAAAASEYKISKLRKDILSGKDAPVGSAAIGEMEKALASLSEKETESIVSGNRELLKSLNFANAISVKQLEAINKSDKFSDAEKDSLKGMRFKSINDAMNVVGPTRSSEIGKIRKNIRDLSDSELEMIDSTYLEDIDFVGHIKSSQFDSINKSSKFTTAQKDKLKATRRKPLASALISKKVSDVKKALKSLGPKEISSIEISMLKIPTMIEAYSPSLLKRMAPEMHPDDVVELRDEILKFAKTPGASADVLKLEKWLNSPDGAMFS